jgi:hypothetical protein
MVRNGPLRAGCIAGQQHSPGTNSPARHHRAGFTAAFAPVWLTATGIDEALVIGLIAAV